MFSAPEENEQTLVVKRVIFSYYPWWVLFAVVNRNGKTRTLLYFEKFTQPYKTQSEKGKASSGQCMLFSVIANLGIVNIVNIVNLGTELQGIMSCLISYEL